MSTAHSRILILDFGSQFTQLIARRLREQKIYTEIYPSDCSLKHIKEFDPKGLILSGGPYSVYDKKAPKCGDIWGLGVPILGICYGMQYMAKVCGAPVMAAKTREYGRTHIRREGKSVLLPDHNGDWPVWMSHGDEIGRTPDGFVQTAVSENGSPAAMEDAVRQWYAVQFHPEVSHTQGGGEILKRFAYDICGCVGDWDLTAYLMEQVKSAAVQVGPKGKAICALSGGVDSTVAATLVQQALGERLQCIFVNNGLLRKDEAEQVLEVYKKELKLNVTYVDASKKFLNALKGVADPEKKRKIIGREFIRIFEAKAKGAKWLVQGTLYPDVIESAPPPRSIQGASKKPGHSSTIKSHHNVGGLPKNMKMGLIEPLRELFKDEVRQVGRVLGVPEKILGRHPFPGPGLAVRCLGAVTPAKLSIIREVDAIFIEEIRAAGLYHQIWQAYAAFLPIRSVGVMGDGRTYDNAVALRAVTSSDGMTADWFPFQPDFLSRVSNRIVNEVRGVNRVVYDISSKPPATIEWE